MWMKPDDIGVDPISLEVIPLVGDVQSAKREDRLGTVLAPPHPAAFHSVFDQVSAGTLDDPAGDRVSGRQVFVVPHPIRVVLQVSAGGGQFLQTRAS